MILSVVQRVLNDALAQSERKRRESRLSRRDAKISSCIGFEELNGVREIVLVSRIQGLGVPAVQLEEIVHAFSDAVAQVPLPVPPSAPESHHAARTISFQGQIADRASVSLDVEIVSTQGFEQCGHCAQVAAVSGLSRISAERRDISAEWNDALMLGRRMYK